MKQNSYLNISKTTYYLIDIEESEILDRITYNVELSDFFRKDINNSYTFGTSNKNYHHEHHINENISFENRDSFIKYILDNNIKINGYYYGLDPNNFPEIKNNSIGAYISYNNSRFDG
jgi:hypothetical protein